MAHSEHLFHHLKGHFAYQALLDALHPLIWSQADKFIASYAPILQDDDRELLIKEGELAVWKTDHSFNPRSVPLGQDTYASFIAHLHKAIINRMHQYTIKKRTQKSPLILLENTESYVYPARKQNLSDQQSIMTLFPAFSAIEYTVYRLHILHGYPLRHIKILQGFPPSTLNQIKTNTVNKIKRRLGIDEH